MGGGGGDRNAQYIPPSIGIFFCLFVFVFGVFFLQRAPRVKSSGLAGFTSTHHSKKVRLIIIYIYIY